MRITGVKVVERSPKDFVITVKELQVVPTNEKPAPDSVIRGQPERYVPERILQHRIRKCQHQYLVTWECYPDTEATKVTLN
ncbi:hypothetical protein RirG_116870 [Rhizophagus irregularis DAOM 197198w]|uniref:Chromo domain-containing protein n=1 Tax=Rhizophagus irregularis (strain DAOM 197198w) TaxID=1432141 RepID=A0A015KI42_RHIIW|nr:hypothetical protein RirG_116870 [Rhizophagus irregularis DAOM 197198w]